MDEQSANAIHCARHDPARVLAECEAKRRLVEWGMENASNIDNEWGDGHSADEIRRGLCDDHGAESAFRFLKILTAPYADHPDFREEWKD